MKEAYSCRGKYLSDIFMGNPYKKNQTSSMHVSKVMLCIKKRDHRTDERPEAICSANFESLLHTFVLHMQLKFVIFINECRNLSRSVGLLPVDCQTQGEEYTKFHAVMIRGIYLFVLRFYGPVKPNGVMSSAVSLSNHTFTGQA